MQQQYRHQAVPYQGQDAFLACTAALRDDAAARDERLLFLLPAAKTEALRDAFGGRSGDVAYLETDERGRNPARLLGLLDTFRSDAGGRQCVGVTEPALVGVSAAGAAEAHFGESVLNAPALQSWPLSLHCLYDTVGLDAGSIDEMRRNHPFVHGLADNPSYWPDHAGAVFATALPQAPPTAAAHDVVGTSLAPAREFVRGRCGALSPERREDLVLAASEMVTNSLRHGDGECRVSVWDDGASVVCEVRDGGRITDPMVGRLPPPRDARAGRGLWMANQLCDLVQIRSAPEGTTVRLYMDR